ncbi:MAG: hypothetical protein V2I33_05465 [Kangiellaceae bacterium]|jgi:folate-binding protein YgfZ|nr:hypothetical protein [Kangiellaceae bacterium]
MAIPSQLIADLQSNSKIAGNENQLTLQATFELADYGVIKIAGADADKLLQGQLTCDVTKVTQHTASLAALCNVKGRVISLFTLLRPFDDDVFYMLMPVSLISITLATLKKYAPFYKVELTDESQQFRVVGWHIDKLGASDLSPFSCVTDEKHNACHIVYPNSHLLSMISIDSGADYHIERNSDTALWYVNAFTAGIAELSDTTSEHFLPHNLNLPELHAVSFDKGCYTGQEVIARMHYKGTLKSHLFLLSADIDESFEVTAKDPIIADQKKIGEVVSAISTEEQLVILGLCKDLIENAKKITVDRGNSPILNVSRITN